MSETTVADVDTAAQPHVRSRRGRRIMALVLVVLLLLLCAGSVLLFTLLGGSGKSRLGVGSAPDETGLVWIRSIYGINDQVEGRFNSPNAAVPGPGGEIWVTDSVAKSLMRFAPDGRFVGMLSPAEETGLLNGRLAIAPDGRIFVCEGPIDTIRIVAPDGTEDDPILIPAPQSIAIKDEVMVVGSTAGFAILNLEGEPQQVIGSRGKGDDQFDYVHGIAISEDDTIYAVDAFNNRLSAWDMEGNRLWIRRLGTPQNNAEMVGDGLAAQDTSDSAEVPDDEALQLPMGLTIDGAGRLVVIDMFESAIAVFDAKDGSFIGKYGDIGEDDGKFFYPLSIGYDAERDWFTVADTRNNRVQIVRIPGSSGGAGIVESTRRVLTGPLRACIFPFLLLLLAIVLWFVWSRLDKRRTRHREESVNR